ncbi:pentapeptide repeat-containing protein [Lacrimispora xylanisolvens]|uniref:pentapeptide repeat-containing protein n=1 Tax=Lacrimispora xylanisolvens TaxID=384636 RepID=UPI002402B903|nr:pentapeptide repeat-containing protein [Paenibacillaceae bacterium]
MTNKKTENKYADYALKLKIDCKNCSGLCCVSLYCTKTDGFPANKEAGIPCTYLDSDYGCNIHSKLSEKNYKGCIAYDCFGAGQRATQLCLKNGTWKTNPKHADMIFETFMIVFQLHQMLWYLVEAFQLTSDNKLKSTIDELIQENEQIAEMLPENCSKTDLSAYRLKVNTVLKQISTAISISTSTSRHSDMMYLGKNFKKANLDGIDFSMSLMIASNFTGCSLKKTNFLGADIRDANVKDTDLSECIFLTQMQINSAIGNKNTRLPDKLCRPAAWF